MIRYAVVVVLMCGCASPEPEIEMQDIGAEATYPVPLVPRPLEELPEGEWEDPLAE